MSCIPNDLLLEIFSRLPAKSVGRFRCVSKQWGSMLRHQYFTELFLTMSRARPRLLFALNRNREWSFFSMPQLQNPYGNSVSLEATFHMKFSEFSRGVRPTFSCLTSGLINFPSVRISPKESDDAVSVIFNPTSRQYVSLPQPIGFYSFIGFDPIDKQLKVLLILGKDHSVLQLGTGETMWRKIQCPLAHYPLNNDKGICINGVLYYLADTFDYQDYDVIVCFDVRSEKFNFIDQKSFGYLFENSFLYRDTKWINYKGKLSLIKCAINFDCAELRLWVLVDAEKQEWSIYVYTLPPDDMKAVDRRNVSVVGMTATGEIVLSSRCVSSEGLYVFYFNPERSTLQRVEIQGIGEYYHEDRVYAFVDLVEDLHVNDAKYLKSSQGLNIIREMPKPIIRKRPKLPKLPKPQKFCKFSHARSEL